MTIILRLTIPNEDPKEIPITQGQSFLIGRGSASNIRIFDPAVSRKHCQITLSGRGLFLQSLTEANQVFVNQNPTETAILQNGDTVRLGNSFIDVVNTSDPNAFIPHTFSTGSSGPAHLTENISVECADCGLSFESTRFEQHQAKEQGNRALQLCPQCSKPPSIPGYEILGPLDGSQSFLKARHSATNQAVLITIWTLLPTSSERLQHLLPLFRQNPVQHPNLVRTVECGEQQGRCYLVVEYFPSRTLAESVETRGPIAPSNALNLARTMLMALEAIHSFGRYHHRLDPGKIMVSDSGAIKLTSLDSALLFNNLDQDSEESGTSSRRAPLSVLWCRGAAKARYPGLDMKSDLHAVGSILYYALSAQPRYADWNDSRDLFEFVERTPPIEALSPTIPYSLARFIEALMSFEPGQSLETAAKALSGLQRVRNYMGQ